MKFTEKTVLLNTLVEDANNFTSLINKVNLETLIKMNTVKKNNTLFIKTYDASKIREIEEYLKQLEEQLIEVKLAIQHANTNTRHEDGNSNYYYIFRLSALNRELADLSEQLQKGELKLEQLSSKPGKGKHYPTNKSIRDSLPTKKVIESINKDLASRITDLQNERLEIRTKLSEFNKHTEVIVKVFEQFND